MSGQSVRIVTAAPGPALDPHRAAWEALARRAAEPNVFAEPFALLPALFAFGSDEVTVVLTYVDSRLIGVFVVERQPRFRGLPVPALVGWTHPHMFFAAPLLAPEAAEIAWIAFLLWTRRAGAMVVEWPMLPATGPVIKALRIALRRVGARSGVIRQFSRALLESGGRSGETYLKSACSAKSRKRWRRLKRRLAEQGKLELRHLTPDQDVTSWANDFLLLEAKGWKGEAKTALASRAADAEFFRDLCEIGHKRDQISMLGLFVDGAPVALQCNLHQGPYGFALKVAFDPEFATWSPGVLLEVDAISHFLDHSDLVWMDSCTGPNHHLMARLWSGQRDIAHLVFTPGGPIRNAALHGLTGLMQAKRWATRRPAPARPPKGS